MDDNQFLTMATHRKIYTYRWPRHTENNPDDYSRDYSAEDNAEYNAECVTKLYC
jgi:hypothetical protein